MSDRKNGEPCVRGVRMLCKYCNQNTVCPHSDEKVAPRTFSMKLVWHNCKTYPPKEFCNDELIGTNGHYVFDMSWFKDKGYFISTIGEDDYRIEDYALENWWWADIQQTVQGEPRFKK